MNTETFKDKSTDRKKRDQERRTELAMLGLLIEKYPREAREKTKNLDFHKEKLSMKHRNKN